MLREHTIDYVTYQDWKILDRYEVTCGAKQGCPRIKVTTVPEMMTIIHQGRGEGPSFLPPKSPEEYDNATHNLLGVSNV